MSDLNKPIEYQVEATAGEAGLELEKIVTILERMEKSISGVASSLSTLKGASNGLPQAFSKMDAANSRAFDTQRITEFSQKLVTYKRLMQESSKSGMPEKQALADPMKNSIKQAERLNAALNGMNPNTPEYAAASAELEHHMGLLSDLERRYNDIRATQVKVNVSEQVSVETEAIDPDEVKTVKLRAIPQYDPEAMKAADMTKADESVAHQMADRTVTVSIETKGVDQLANVQKELQRLDAQIQRRKNNMVKFSVSGDQVSLMKEAAKLEKDLAARKAFSDAAVNADAPYKEMSVKAAIPINNGEQYAEAERQLKKLERTLADATASLRKFAAEEDAVGVEKMTNKIVGVTSEIERYKTALSGASHIKVEMGNTRDLEDVYANMEKLRSRINQKSFMGKNAFNSAEVRRLQIELTEAEKAAVGLRAALGQIDGGHALAKNAQLTAKGFIQSRFHAARMNAELRKSQHSMLRVSRVLELMALRMGVRAILKDMRAGFATLADQFEPFNDAMSRMMDSATRVRNNLISAFDPLIRVAAPVAEKVLDRIAVGFDKIAQAAAAMTGETMYTKLTSEAQDYADTVNDVQNSLAGFDKFNTIGSQTYAGGAKFKTEVERVPIEDEFLKWKHIGDGLKEVFEGAGEVINDFFTDIATLLGKANNEDTFEFLGDKLAAAGKYMKEHENGLSNILKGYIAVKGASGLFFKGLASFTAVKTGLGTLKGLFGASKVTTAASAATTAGKAVTTAKTAESAGKLATAGKAVWGYFSKAGTKITTAAKSLGSALKGKAATATAGKAVGTAGTTAASGGAAAGVATLAIPAVIGTGAYFMTKTVTDDLVPEVKTVGEQLREMAKTRTGEDMGNWDSLKFFVGEMFRGNWDDYVPATTAPSLSETTNVTNNTSTTELNQSVVMKNFTDGVEKAVSKALKENKLPVNVTVKASADTDRLFRFVVDQNNAQYNRTGRSPLKV